MRIVAGAHRGRGLVAPKGHSTRPTADRTRQALFDVLVHAPWSKPISGTRVIDLFAGSGALGLEALSRGAASCLFVDNRPAARESIAVNLAALGLTDQARILTADATGPPAGLDGPFDLAFLDPPYGQGLVEPALRNLAANLAPGALIAVETGADDEPFVAPAYQWLDARRWGPAKVTFLRKT